MPEENIYLHNAPAYNNHPLLRLHLPKLRDGYEPLNEDGATLMDHRGCGHDHLLSKMKQIENNGFSKWHYFRIRHIFMIFKIVASVP